MSAINELLYSSLCELIDYHYTIVRLSIFCVFFVFLIFFSFNMFIFGMFISVFVVDSNDKEDQVRPTLDLVSYQDQEPNSRTKRVCKSYRENTDTSLIMERIKT